MKSKIVLIALCISSCLVQAQIPIYNYDEIDSIAPFGIGKSIVANVQGEYYVAGEIRLSSTFNQNQLYQLVSGNKVWTTILSKFSKEGNLLWSFVEDEYGDSQLNRVNSIDLDEDGNIIVGGYYHSGLIFGHLSLENTYGGHPKPFVAKFSPEGSIIFLRTIHPEGIDSHACIISLSTDSQGNTYFGGYFSGTITVAGHTIQHMNLWDNFWGKMDPLGNVLWVRAAGSTAGESGVRVKADPSGNLYVYGAVAGQPTPNYIGDSINVKGRGFITKYNTAGEMLWLRSADRGYFLPSTQPQDRMIDEKEGKVIICGYMTPENDTFSIAGLHASPIVSTASDRIGFSLQLDEEGNGNWLTEIIETDSSFAQGIAFKANGDALALYNMYGGYIKFLDTVLSSIHQTNHFFTLDGVDGTVKNYFYTRHPDSIHNSQPSTQIRNDVTSFYLKNDTVLVTGSFDFQLNGSPRLFIGKLFLNTLHVAEHPKDDFEVYLYPNPSTGKVYLKNKLSQQTKIKRLVVIDIRGKKVYTQSDALLGDNPLELDLVDLQSGIYLISVEMDHRSYTEKIMLEKGF